MRKKQDHVNFRKQEKILLLYVEVSGKMQVTEEILKKAKKDAMDNYSTWGQWIVECYDDDELRESLEDVDRDWETST